MFQWEILIIYHYDFLCDVLYVWLLWAFLDQEIALTMDKQAVVFSFVKFLLPVILLLLFRQMDHSVNLL